MSTFGDIYRSKLHDCLDDIVQTSTVEAFYNHFEAIKELVSSSHPWLPAVYFADRFIYGLRSDIQPYVINCQPCTVFDAYHLALIYLYSLLNGVQQVNISGEAIDNIVTVASNVEASTVECLEIKSASYSSNCNNNFVEDLNVSINDSCIHMASDVQVVVASSLLEDAHNTSEVKDEIMFTTNDHDSESTEDEQEKTSCLEHQTDPDNSEDEQHKNSGLEQQSLMDFHVCKEQGLFECNTGQSTASPDVLLKSRGGFSTVTVTPSLAASDLLKNLCKFDDPTSTGVVEVMENDESVRDKVQNAVVVTNVILSPNHVVPSMNLPCFIPVNQQFRHLLAFKGGTYITSSGIGSRCMEVYVSENNMDLLDNVMTEENRQSSGNVEGTRLVSLASIAFKESNSIFDTGIEDVLQEDSELVPQVISKSSMIQDMQINRFESNLWRDVPEFDSCPILYVSAVAYLYFAVEIPLLHIWSEIDAHVEYDALAERHKEWRLLLYDTTSIGCKLICGVVVTLEKFVELKSRLSMHFHEIYGTCCLESYLLRFVSGDYSSVESSMIVCLSLCFDVTCRLVVSVQLFDPGIGYTKPYRFRAGLWYILLWWNNAPRLVASALQQFNQTLVSPVLLIVEDLIIAIVGTPDPAYTFSVSSIWCFDPGGSVLSFVFSRPYSSFTERNTLEFAIPVFVQVHLWGSSSYTEQLIDFPLVFLHWLHSFLLVSLMVYSLAVTDSKESSHPSLTAISIQRTASYCLRLSCLFGVARMASYRFIWSRDFRMCELITGVVWLYDLAVFSIYSNDYGSTYEDNFPMYWVFTVINKVIVTHFKGCNCGLVENGLAYSGTSCCM